MPWYDAEKNFYLLYLNYLLSSLLNRISYTQVTLCLLNTCSLFY